MTLLIALAGGLGAATRYGIGEAFRPSRYPWATTAINITGSFLLGLLVGSSLSNDWQSIAGVGFLGGYTTFSTASYETAKLTEEGRYGAALANGLGQLLAAVAAASLGYWLTNR